MLNGAPVPRKYLSREIVALHFEGWCQWKSTVSRNEINFYPPDRQSRTFQPLGGVPLGTRCWHAAVGPRRLREVSLSGPARPDHIRMMRVQKFRCRFVVDTVGHAAYDDC